jgi:hypothetical protein
MGCLKTNYALIWRRFYTLLRRRTVKKKAKKPYSQRRDTEKLDSNWTKTLGLFERAEYSMAVIRASTCVEIAANIVIRSELVEKRHLQAAFVDTLLLWANGLQGKFSRIILPLFKGTSQHTVLKKYHKAVKSLNDTRNAITHSGRFSSKESAEKLLHLAHGLCSRLVSYYEPTFKLKKP